MTRIGVVAVPLQPGQEVDRLHYEMAANEADVELHQHGMGRTPEGRRAGSHALTP